MARAGMENLVSKAKQCQISGEKMVGEKMVASKAKMVGEKMVASKANGKAGN